MINGNIKGIQIDQNENTNIKYKHKKHFSQCVWAGCNFCSIKFEDSAEIHEIDFSNYFKKESTLRKDISQFIVRFVNGKLLEEKVVRLENGFPTTEREKNEFDILSKKNDQAYLEKVRQLVKENPSLLKDAKKMKRGNNTVVNKQKKVGRNEFCSCGSGKKFKKCCENKN